MPAPVAHARKTSYQTSDRNPPGIARRVLLLAHTVPQKQKRVRPSAHAVPDAALHQRFVRAFRFNLIVSRRYVSRKVHSPATLAPHKLGQ